MNYDEFEKKLLTELKNDDEECINTALNNEKLIQIYLQDNEESSHIKSLVNGINNIILNKTKEFSYIERILQIDSMRNVLSEFRESDILLRACQINNSIALKWLIKMDINPFISDEKGMTSLMYASEHLNLYFVVEYLVQKNEKLLHIVDNNGENALFHTLGKSFKTFEYLLDNTKIDVNLRNNDKENVLFVSCRNGLSQYVERLAEVLDIDCSFIDKEGRNVLMCLLENEDYICLNKLLHELRTKELSNKGHFNINYYNEIHNETLSSMIIKKFFKMCCENDYRKIISDKRDLVTAITISFALIMSFPGFDINAPIDGDGNTPIMFFMMIGDYVTTSFILSYHKNNIDLGIKNKYGISASTLALDLKNEHFLIQNFIEHKTFDKGFIDQHNNNLLIYSVLFKNIYSFMKIINDNEKAVEQINDKNEDVLIISTKTGFLDKINSYSIRNANFNHQDDLGNSALFYAVKLKSKYDINLLALNHADPNLKNKQDQSPMDLAKQMEEDDLIKIMKKPKPVHEMKKKLEKGKSGGRSLFKNKKSSSDEKLEDYVKNYQINNYSEDYKDIIQNCYTYHSEERPLVVDKQLALTYYITLEHCESIALNNVNAKDIYESRRSEYSYSRKIVVWEDSYDEKLLIPINNYYVF